MTVLIKQAARWLVSLLAIGWIILLLLFGWYEAVSFAAAGLVAGVDFLAIIYLGVRLTDPSARGTGRAAMAILMMAKLAFVAGLLWLVITQLGAWMPGVVAGIALSLVAFVAGSARLAGSPEGQLAVAAEEQRIGLELAALEKKEQ